MDAFRRNNLVPNIIGEIPLAEAEVKFPNAFFRLGDTLKPAQVKQAPDVLWAAEDDSLYTLAFIDPDAPKEYASFLHWLVINIPGRDISKGDHYVAFMGSAPPEGSGIHRYMFLVFKQPKRLELTESDLPRVSTPQEMQKRIKFNMKKWINKYGLGRPIAGTFYKAEFQK